MAMLFFRRKNFSFSILSFFSDSWGKGRDNRKVLFTENTSNIFFSLQILSKNFPTSELQMARRWFAEFCAREQGRLWKFSHINYRHLNSLARPTDILKCPEQQPETEVLNKIIFLGLPVKESLQNKLISTKIWARYFWRSQCKFRNGKS